MIHPRLHGRGLVAVATLLLGLVAAPAARPVPAPAAPGALARPAPRAVPVGHVTGTDGRVYLADAQGRAVQHRGFNTGKDMEADVAEITPELMAAAAASGFDLMRLAYHWHKLEPADDAWDEGYLDQIVAALDLAEAHGVSVVLDNHQDIFGPRFGGGGVPDWATDDDGLPFTYDPTVPWFVNYLQPGVQAAWENLYEDADRRAEQEQAVEHVVERVAGHPALLGYDLLNEPFGRIRPGEDLVAAAARVEATQITPMYQRLTDVIRRHDQRSWIFIESPNLASLGLRTSLGPVDDDKVAYLPHLYDVSLESGSAYDPATSTFLADYEAVITHYPDTYDVPMMVGEWGLPNPAAPGVDVYVRDVLRLLERRTSGWTVFTWCEGGGYCVLDGDGALDPTWRQLVQAWPRAIAGAPTSSTWDPEARTLRVTFRADGGVAGPTEVVVPAGLYDGAPVVEVSGRAGTWTSTTDPDTGLVGVEVPDDGAVRTICVSPSGVADGCGALPADEVDPGDPGDPGDPTGVVPTAPSAVPVSATARFTG